MSWVSAGRRIHDLTEGKMKTNPALSYIEAMLIVKQENPDLFDQYHNLNRTLDTNPAIIDTPPKIPYPRGYTVGHPDFADPFGRIKTGRDPRTINFNSTGGNMTPEEAGKKIDQLVQKYRHDHPNVDYKGAMDQVLSMNPDLKEAYSAILSHNIERFEP